MRKLIFFLFLCCLSSIIWADQVNAVYQVDLVLFQNLVIGSDSDESSLTPALPPLSNNNISLQSGEYCQNKLYCLLPLKNSHLKDSWYALKRDPNFEVLAHYSWLQAASNRKAVELPPRMHRDFAISGTVRVRKLNYFYLHSELVIAPGMGQVPMALTHTRRIRENETVYIDHPQIGMLVRVEKKETATE